jgi:uncharacterized lipoprotein YehR (DUF1307 family)
MTETSSETGLVEATENREVTVPVTLPAVVQQAPSLTALPPGFTIPAAAALARDLAIHLYDDDVILKKHNVTDDQFATLSANTFFHKLLETATTEWNSLKSVQQRLALEASVAVEDVLPDITARMRNATEPLPGVVEALKAFTKIAGIGESKQVQPIGERFSININLSGETQAYEKNRTPGSTVEIRTLPEGPGNPAPVLDIPRGS